LRGAFIDDSSSLLSGVLEGLGFGLLRWTLAAAELRAGRIVLASEHIVPHRFAYYFVCPEAYATFPKVAALRDWVLQQGREFAPPPTAAAKPTPPRRTTPRRTGTA
jgi:LysR family glycine cleavage system transcriptional activator